MDVESNNSIIGTVQLLILVFNKKKGIVCAKKECYHLEVNVYYMALFGTSLDIIAVKLKRMQDKTQFGACITTDNLTLYTYSVLNI
jgi:hypothetical protein